MTMNWDETLRIETEGMDERLADWHHFRYEPTPYDYQDTPHNSVDFDNDPFAEFGDSVSIDDNFLD